MAIYRHQRITDETMKQLDELRAGNHEEALESHRKNKEKYSKGPVEREFALSTGEEVEDMNICDIRGRVKGGDYATVTTVGYAVSLFSELR